MAKDADWEQKIDRQNLPRHIAIIMDGNGRWAKKKLMPRTIGHRGGMSTLRKMVEACVELKIPVLTVFAFSTENWKRPREEVDYLMNLLIEFMQKEIEELHRQNVRVRVFGDYTKLPGRCVNQVEEACRITENNNGLTFNIAINYGARDEIVRAARQAAIMVAKGEISSDEITEETIGRLLYTAGITDPDLLIRTAGEMRISNFLLWQIAYAELWFTDVLWPDFTREDLMQAIYDYQHRSRRFGGLN
ncbi:MAG TPA: isoprenyl transferase [Syntrophomonas sp.]|jgi:undecaprenyl diphosphate synthase|nr:isoprenyl transferase [Syntrophomonas sp.]HCF70039.1 isoprenyl transferase [Syntrophomonas sp.]